MGAVRETELQGGEDCPGRGGHRAHLPLQPTGRAAAERPEGGRGEGRGAERRDRGADGCQADQEVHHRIHPEGRQGQCGSLCCCRATPKIAVTHALLARSDTIPPQSDVIKFSGKPSSFSSFLCNIVIWSWKALYCTFYILGRLADTFFSKVTNSSSNIHKL